MATVAEQLHRAREAHTLSIRQVAEATKMRTDHVRALEEGNYDAFVAPVYIRGFVRTYARLVKLDEREMMATLEAELAQTEKFREPPRLLRQERTSVDALMLQVSRVNWRLALPLTGVLLGVVILFCVDHAVRQGHAREPLAGIAPRQYQPPQHPAGETLPVPSPHPARR